VKVLRDEAYKASAELAAEKGRLPLFDRNAFLARPISKPCRPKIRSLIARHGIRMDFSLRSPRQERFRSRRQYFERYTSRFLPIPIGQCADGRRNKREEKAADFAYRTFRAMFGGRGAASRLFRDRAGLSPADHLKVASRGAALYRFGRSPRRSIVRPAFPSTISRTFTARLMRKGCKGCHHVSPQCGDRCRARGGRDCRASIQPVAVKPPPP